jgi:hypothetical protein
MPEAQKKFEQAPSDMRLDGFEQIFAETTESASAATASGELQDASQIEKVLERLTEIISSSVDQRVENARLAGQVIENQRQLIATQQILIRLMEKSIELTKHISSIEEKLPVVFELPHTVECIKDRIIRLEGIEID